MLFDRRSSPVDVASPTHQRGYCFGQISLLSFGTIVVVIIVIIVYSVVVAAAVCLFVCCALE